MEITSSVGLDKRTSSTTKLPHYRNTHKRLLPALATKLSSLQPMDRDVSDFRWIATPKWFQPVSSLQHAYEYCSSESAQEKAMGLQYVGWHSLVQAHSSWHRGEPNNSDKIEYAIVRLKESIDAGQFVLLSALVMYLVNRTPDASFSDTWYLLGRAYQERDAHREAHGAFQQAVYSEPSASVYWLSIAILFFRINQYRDSFDAMDRSVRLNPFAAISVAYSRDCLVATSWSHDSKIASCLS